MKERPILFSAPMVRAILDGTKTQTRRLVNWKPRDKGVNLEASSLIAGPYANNDPKYGWVLRSRGGQGCWEDRTLPLQCPHGGPGDRLWIRESLWNEGDDCWNYSADNAALKDGSPEVVLEWTRANASKGAIPSIHMPRWASRIDLELTAVRIERLQDISEEDAFAEGVDTEGEPYNRAEHAALAGVQGDSPARFAYAWLWDDINGAGAWDKNPWVWVETFKRVRP